MYGVWLERGPLRPSGKRKPGSVRLARPLKELAMEGGGKDMAFGLQRGSESARSRPETYALADAAQRALDTARIEKLPLAYIAARNGEDRAQHWFANNMLHVVSVMGRRPDSTASEVLTSSKIDGLTLDRDMRVLGTGGAANPTFVDLRVPLAEFAKYIAFVRTTQ